ncbi:MAG: c-type cytochrome [Planctomycetota bacterium]|nr:c-type cytochrome [Planctomycetota bacterium]
MISPEYDKRLDHDSDGIEIYDNPLPGWWSSLFWISIVFSVGYFAYYHIGVGATVEENYDTSVALFLEAQFSDLIGIEPTDQLIIDLYQGEYADKISALRGTFESKCGQCHRADGGGNIGPNLTDGYYKNVKSPVDLYRTISDGVVAKGMPAWKNQMREIQVILMAAYVASIRDSNPSSPKLPEGLEIPAWDTFIVPVEEAEESADEGDANTDDPSDDEQP